MCDVTSPPNHVHAIIFGYSILQRVRLRLTGEYVALRTLLWVRFTIDYLEDLS